MQKNIINNQHILIIGGMGPQASVYAHRLLVSQATSRGASNNEDYPRITHVSINVHDFISNPKYKNEALEYILDCLSDIDMHSVTDGFIACNTAHLLFNEINSSLPFELTSLISETSNYVDSRRIEKIGILATPSTIDSNLYRDVLTNVRSVINPSKESFVRTEKIIRDVISGVNLDSSARSLKHEMGLMKKSGADSIILGCTELSLLSDRLGENDYINPLEIVIDKILK